MTVQNRQGVFRNRRATVQNDRHKGGTVGVKVLVSVYDCPATAVNGEAISITDCLRHGTPLPQT